MVDINPPTAQMNELNAKRLHNVSPEIVFLIFICVCPSYTSTQDLLC